MLSFDEYTKHIARIGQKVRYAESRNVFIFDLDGTLADGKHRLHMLPTKDLHLTESWIDFNRASRNDDPITSTIRVMNAIKVAGGYVIVLTGRSDDVMSETRQWLALNGCKYDELVMRSHQDNRKDTVIKEEFLRVIGFGNVVAAWDDSPNVIAHFRKLGITTYQVCDYADANRTDLKSHGVDKL